MQRLTCIFALGLAACGGVGQGPEDVEVGSDTAELRREHIDVPVEIPAVIGDGSPDGITRDRRRVQAAEDYLNKAARNGTINSQEVAHVKANFRDVFDASGDESYQNPRIEVLERLLADGYQGIRLSLEGRRALCELVNLWTDDGDDC